MDLDEANDENQTATGGIITKPTLIRCGDGSPETIIPLSALKAFNNHTMTTIRLCRKAGAARQDDALNGQE